MKSFGHRKLLVAMIVATVALVWLGQRADNGTSFFQSVTSHVKSATSSNTDTFNKHRYSTTDATSPWVIVNKQHPLTPLDYQPADLTGVGNGQLLRSTAASALQTMLRAAQAAKIKLVPASGYRSYDTQVVAYESEVSSYGQATADDESARPGYSEHQTGWAIDFGTDGCSIADCFSSTKAGKWVAANAYKYGFLQRYTTSKVSVTGYRAESWHYRYVGKPLAAELHDRHVQTLEEFFGVSGGSAYN